MKEFRITSDRHAFIGETEIRPVNGIDIHIEPCENPQITLRTSIDGIDTTLQFSVERLTIDGYTDIRMDCNPFRRG